MNCPTEFRIFRGRRVTHLPKNCDVCFVLCISDCRLYRKKLACRHKNCNSCGSFKWIPIDICEPFIFYDVCKELIIPIGFTTLGSVCCDTGACKVKTSSGCCVQGTNPCSAIDPVTASIAGVSNGSCTFRVATGTALRGVSNSGSDIAEISVCNAVAGEEIFSGTIGGCATKSLIITSPKEPLEGEDFRDTDTSTPCVQDPFDAETNTEGISTLLFQTTDGAFRAGFFRASDLSFPLTDVGDVPSSSTAFGTWNSAAGANSLAMGLNSDAYLPGAMAHSSCLSPQNQVRPAPPNQPIPPDQGTCQYMRFLMVGITRCLDEQCLCEFLEKDCLNPDDIGCLGDDQTCLPNGVDCQNITENKYAVTDFVFCDPNFPTPTNSTDCDFDLSSNCPFLPYTGTAFGTIDIVSPRVVGCNTKLVNCGGQECYGCPFGQRWCFVISRVQVDNEIQHVVSLLEQECGNNGSGALAIFNLCIFPTACDDNGIVRFCFRLIRNNPIGTDPGDDIVPEYCATVRWTMVASKFCTRICEPPEEEFDDCFICCPIPIEGDVPCRPTCTATINCTDCGTPSSTTSTNSTTSTTSTTSTVSSVRKPFSMPRTNKRTIKSKRSLARKPCTSCGGNKSKTIPKSKTD